MKIDNDFVNWIRNKENDIDCYCEREDYTEGIDGAYWVCYYLLGSLDARFAAAIVDHYAKLVGQKLHLVGVTDINQWPVLFKDLEKFMRVFIVGFSFPPEAMLKFDEHFVWEELFWADQSKKSRKESSKYDYMFKFQGIRTEKYSAAEQTYSRLFDSQVAMSVHLFDRYVVGDLKNPNSEPFYRALLASPDTSVRSEIWSNILPQYYRTPLQDKKGTKKRREFIRNMIEAGRRIIQTEKEQDAEYAKKYAFEREIQINGRHFRAIVVNRGDARPKMLESVFDPDKHDLMMSMVYSGEEWDITVRSPKRKINCFNIAKLFGGSGSSEEASFRCPNLEMLEQYPSRLYA